jgi:hypothetical protein
LVGLRTPHVWGPCQRPQWCRRARRCSHTYVETMILHAVMCGWLWRMAEPPPVGVAVVAMCVREVCAEGGGGGLPQQVALAVGMRLCSPTLQHNATHVCWWCWGPVTAGMDRPWGREVWLVPAACACAWEVLRGPSACALCIPRPRLCACTMQWIYALIQRWCKGQGSSVSPLAGTGCGCRNILPTWWLRFGVVFGRAKRAPGRAPNIMRQPAPNSGARL